ncbi:MAG: hypothetical protein CM1200mP2_17950 [Planctomycetaceae bacterium]|nr:MAG: hypothetical protein CM1200mP2_17950 [Planctomycetaceae bacterium]
MVKPTPAVTNHKRQVQIALWISSTGDPQTSQGYLLTTGQGKHCNGKARGKGGKGENWRVVNPRTCATLELSVFRSHTGWPWMSLARFSVKNRVLVNMLMLVILMAGGIFAFTLVRKFFPESRPDKVMIPAVYPGQKPEEVEKSVTIKVEEAVHDIEGIEKVDSTVSEGVSMTTLTLYSDVEDINVVVQEVKRRSMRWPTCPKTSSG